MFLLLQLAIALVAWAGYRSKPLVGTVVRRCIPAALVAWAFPSSARAAAAAGHARVLLTFSPQDRTRLEVECSGGFR